MNEGRVPPCSFNASGEHIACPVSTGFIIRQSFPRRDVISRDDLGPLLLARLKQTTNLLAFVSSTSPNTVTLYDDSRRRVIGSLGPYATRVVNVDFGEDVIAVLLDDNRILVYELGSLRLIYSDSTGDNPNGALAVVSCGNESKIAYPGPEETGSVVIAASTSRRPPTKSLFRCHTRSLAALCFSSDGSRLATASTKGTIIRIFDVQTKDLAVELRRSIEQATMYSMSFSYESPPSLLACASNKGTLHVFRLANAASPRLTRERSRWRCDLPDKHPCAISFHRGAPRPLLTAVSQATTWHAAMLADEDGSVQFLEMEPGEFSAETRGPGDQSP
jgi:WD40 repeat protein